MYKMLIGMSMMVVVTELFLSDSGFKKYIRAVVGVFVFVVMIEGVLSTSVFDGGCDLLEEAEKLSQNTILAAESKIVDEYEIQIKKILQKHNLKAEIIKVKCDMNLVLKSVGVKIERASDETLIRDILINEMGIDEKIIEITANSGD